jgi:hypothetical protein
MAVVAGGGGTKWTAGGLATSINFVRLGGLAVEETPAGRVLWIAGASSLSKRAAPDVIGQRSTLVKVEPDGTAQPVYGRARYWGEQCGCVVIPFASASNDTPDDPLVVDLPLNVSERTEVAALGDGTVIVAQSGAGLGSAVHVIPGEVAYPVLGVGPTVAGVLPNDGVLALESGVSFPAAIAADSFVLGVGPTVAGVLPNDGVLALESGVSFPAAIAADSFGRVLVASGASGHRYMVAFRPRGTAQVAFSEGMPLQMTDFALLPGGQIVLSGRFSGTSDEVRLMAVAWDVRRGLEAGRGPAGLPGHRRGGGECGGCQGAGELGTERRSR